jgi:hypothetical protein
LKTFRNLYPQVCAWENLELAYRKARKGKRARKPVASSQALSSRLGGVPCAQALIWSPMTFKPHHDPIYLYFVTATVLNCPCSQPPSRGRLMRPSPA